MKICAVCKISKNLDDFGRDKLGVDQKSSACKECRNKKAKEYRKNNAEKLKQKERQRYLNRREEQIIYSRNRRKLKDVKLARNHKQREKYKTSPEFIASHRIRSLLARTLKASGKKKNSSTSNLLGYTSQELRENIELKFQAGMTWENRGEWHIDHVKPIAQFIKEGITDPPIINALDNLQPLWATDNLSKGSKYIETPCIN